MKKLLFLLVCLFVFCRCMPGGDQSCETEFYVSNQTDANIVLDVSYQPLQVAIDAGETSIILRMGGLCGEEGSWADR